VKRRLGGQLGLQIVFLCKLCDGTTTSKVGMVSHREGPHSCVRDSKGIGKRAGNTSLIDAFVGLEPQPLPCMGSGSARGGRSASNSGRGRGRGGGRSGGPARSGGGGGGRGRTSAATKEKQKAKLAAFLAAKYPDGKAGQAAAQTAGNQGAATSSSTAGAEPEVDDDVEILGERTTDERNAEGAKEAIDLDA
jgi:hypothetical protein